MDLWHSIILSILRLLNDHMREIYASIPSHVIMDTFSHEYSSFSHLTSYGACFYSYLSAKLFAKDLFSYIKHCGLFNKNVGKKLIEDILSNGASQSPYLLMKNFLGRNPSPEAFMNDLELAFTQPTVPHHKYLCKANL